MLNLSFLALALLVPNAIAKPLGLSRRQASLDDFITSESAISRQGILNNTGPDGSAVPGASAGVVVASPFKVNPDC